MWQLRKHTNGEVIYYQILNLPLSQLITKYELPVRIPNVAKDVNIQINTQMNINNEIVTFK